MSDYKSAAFVEGGRVDGVAPGASDAEWHYRINRLARLDGPHVYEVLLTCDDPHRKGGTLYYWLSEFATLEQAREAAHRVLSDMVIFMNRPEALGVARKD